MILNLKIEFKWRLKINRLNRMEKYTQIAVKMINKQLIIIKINSKKNQGIIEYNLKCKEFKLLFQVSMLLLY